MKISTKSQRKEFKNGNFCTAYEYPIGDKSINGAVIELTGRYPENGSAQNLVCKEMAYVVDGGGKVVVEGVEYSVNEGDVVLIDPGEKFYWEGDMELFMPCAPAWDPAQYRTVE